MEDISDISSRSLRSLSPVTRTLLSSLLNSTKVLPHEGRSRDWRGIAGLTGVTAEEEANILNYDDKFSKVLELWMDSRGGTVGELLQHLITLDRHDVYEDVVESIRQQIQLRPDNQVAILNNNHINNNVNGVDDYEMITFDDRPGYQHRYHAYILSADEDYEFTSELTRRLKAEGFQLCSKENLRPGFATQFPPVAKLIAERCQRVILVYSPDFLTCRDNSFLRDYTQAISIQHSPGSMIPIVYRECELPMHVRLYTMLRYSSALGGFWERLITTLDRTRGPRLNGITAAPAPSTSRAIQESSTHSALNIETISASQSHTDDDKHYFIPSKNQRNQQTNNLTLPSVPLRTVNGNSTPNLVIPGNSLPVSEGLPLSTSSVSLAQSDASGQRTMDSLIRRDKTNKKRPNKIKKWLNQLKGKGKKEEPHTC